MTLIQDAGVELSLNKQLEHVADGYDNILRNGKSGVVKLVDGTKYTMITVDGSITYYVDKSTSEVKDFYKRHRGFIIDIIESTRQQNDKLRKRIYGTSKEQLLSLVEPHVEEESREKEVAQIAAFRAKGKIFVHSWGYDARINDFVLVVSETPKTVDVVKLKKKITGNWDSGSAVPVAEWESRTPFQLRKGIEGNGTFVLRGRDKSDTGSSESVTWYEWDKRPMSEYNVH